MPNSKLWIHCNDAAVLRADESKVNNTPSYIYSYLFARRLGYLSLSLSVTALHITLHCVTLYGKYANALVVVCTHYLTCPQQWMNIFT